MSCLDEFVKMISTSADYKIEKSRQGCISVNPPEYFKSKAWECYEKYPDEAVHRLNEKYKDTPIFFLRTGRGVRICN